MSAPSRPQRPLFEPLPSHSEVGSQRQTHVNTAVQRNPWECRFPPPGLARQPILVAEA